MSQIETSAMARREAASCGKAIDEYPPEEAAHRTTVLG
jgi:hypothetical protein